MTIYQAYTYYIAWSHLNLHYYGVRTANKCLPEKDFWQKYFTSSDIVREYREQYGDPDIKEIRQKFDTAEEAIAWEVRVLQKLNVVKNDKWLNQCMWPSRPMRGENHYMFGKTHTAETRQKISESMRNMSAETRQKMSEAQKGKTLSDEHRQKISEARKGKPRSPETRKKISDSNKGKKRSTSSRRKMSEKAKGRIPWNKGIPRDAATRLKISLALKNRKDNN